MSRMTTASRLREMLLRTKDYMDKKEKVDNKQIFDFKLESLMPVLKGEIPSLTFATKYELKNLTFESPAILSTAVCQVSIITDSPVIPQEYLALCASLAIKSGMDEKEALKAYSFDFT